MPCERQIRLGISSLQDCSCLGDDDRSSTMSSFLLTDEWVKGSTLLSASPCLMALEKCANKLAVQELLEFELELKWERNSPNIIY